MKGRVQLEKVNVNRLREDYLLYFRCAYCKHDCKPSETQYKIQEKYEGWFCRGFRSVYS